MTEGLLSCPKCQGENAQMYYCKYGYYIICNVCSFKSPYADTSGEIANWWNLQRFKKEVKH